MHAMPVAEELGITRVLVPRFPGHLSALGQMLADLRRDAVAAWGGRVPELPIDTLRARARAMREEGAATLEADGMARERHRHEFTLDVRYVGQSFTLPVRWDPDDADWAPLRAAFDARHEETFGYADPANDVEIVNVRLVSIAEVDKPALDFTPIGAGDPEIERRAVWFGEWRETPVLDRERLAVGYRSEGPAIVEEAGGDDGGPARLDGRGRPERRPPVRGKHPLVDGTRGSVRRSSGTSSTPGKAVEVLGRTGPKIDHSGFIGGDHHFGSGSNRPIALCAGGLPRARRSRASRLMEASGGQLGQRFDARAWTIATLDFAHRTRVTLNARSPHRR